MHCSLAVVELRELAAALERARADRSAWVRELARATLLAIDGHDEALAVFAADRARKASKATKAKAASTVALEPIDAAEVLPPSEIPAAVRAKFHPHAEWIVQADSGRVMAANQGWSDHTARFAWLDHAGALPVGPLAKRRFAGADAQVLALSCDTRHAQKQWAEQQGFSFPVLSDFWPHGAVAKAYGVFNEDLGCANGATLVIDKTGKVVDTFSSANHGTPRERAENEKASSARSRARLELFMGRLG